MKSVILSVSLSLLLSFSVASAQLAKLTVGYTSLAAGQLPAWMAKESGIFRNNGLDVQLVYFRGGTVAVAALLSREIPISEMSGPLVVSASLRGADTVMIAGGIVVTERYSKAILFPSIQPSLLNSCRNGSTRTALPDTVLASRKPIRETFPVCCASAR